MSEKKLYGKIFCDEGVVFEKKFETEAEAKAFIEGAMAGIDAADPDNDFYSVCVHSEPATKEN